MAVPKRKKSKMRVRMRKGQVKADVAQVSACPNCGAPKRAHRVCPECGYRCNDCLGTDTVVSRERLKDLAFDPRFNPENLAASFENTEDEEWYDDDTAGR